QVDADTPQIVDLAPQRQALAIENRRGGIVRTIKSDVAQAVQRQADARLVIGSAEQRQALFEQSSGGNRPAKPGGHVARTIQRPGTHYGIATRQCKHLLEPALGFEELSAREPEPPQGGDEPERQVNIACVDGPAQRDAQVVSLSIEARQRLAAAGPSQPLSSFIR